MQLGPQAAPKRQLREHRQRRACLGVAEQGGGLLPDALADQHGADRGLALIEPGAHGAVIGEHDGVVSVADHRLFDGAGGGAHLVEGRQRHVDPDDAAFRLLAEVGRGQALGEAGQRHLIARGGQRVHQRRIHRMPLPDAVLDVDRGDELHRAGSGNGPKPVRGQLVAQIVEEGRQNALMAVEIGTPVDVEALHGRDAFRQRGIGLEVGVFQRLAVGAHHVVEHRRDLVGRKPLDRDVDATAPQRRIDLPAGEPVDQRTSNVGRERRNVRPPRAQIADRGAGVGLAQVRDQRRTHVIPGQLRCGHRKRILGRAPARHPGHDQARKQRQTHGPS